MLKDLANTYIETTVKYGVTCCHHTCGNIIFNQWVIQMSSLSASTLQQYANIMNGATNMGLEVKNNPSNSSSNSDQSSSNQGQSNNVNSPGETVSAATVESSSSNSAGANAHEISAVNSQKSSASSGMPIYAIIGVIFLLGIFGAGYYFKGK
jgi:cobaltochelatase CobN